MDILNLQRKRTGYKLIGMSVHLELHHYLTLYSLAKGTPKAKLLKDMLNKWIDAQKAKEEDVQLLKQIAQRGMNLWRIGKTKGINKPLSEFKEALGKELRGKELTEGEVKRILNEMR